jgi:hypothetical protein
MSEMASKEDLVLVKNQIKEIYTEYGLSDEEFETYLVYLGNPQITVSETAGIMEKEEVEDEGLLDRVKVITEKLEKTNFIKKLPGKIGAMDRYIPLEPYLEMFNKKSGVFRDEISTIKDNVLADQSSRFENLEGIEKNAVGSIDTAVNTQVEDFFKVSDSHDVDKKTVIENANKRFTDTSKALEGAIQTTTFAARDRFTETSKTLEKSLQDILFKGRDRYETTSKTLETDLHKHIDDDYELFKNEVNARDTDAIKGWDDNSAKFTGDNTALNTELDTFSGAHNTQTKALEGNLHKVIDDLNGKLKGIADGFKSKYDGGIQEQKNTINKIVDDLLKDMVSRVQKIEMECKKDLDGHVDHHKEHAENLKPKLDEILDKYILRFKDVLEDLKGQISTVLSTHEEHVAKTTTDLKDQLNNKIGSRQEQLIGQVKTFEKNTVILIDNLKDISDKMTELGKVLAGRGSAWKALFLGKHKVYQEQYDEIKERVSKISGSMKEDFENSTANYIDETAKTSKQLQGEVVEITAKENNGLKSESESLDKKQKETIDAELEGIAADLSKETDATLKHNIDHCKETTVKLKDSLENSLHTHQEEYDIAINKHRQNGLKHYDESNANVEKDVTDWYASMDSDQKRAKSDITGETENQIRDTNDHLKKTKDKNVDHSRDFERDVKDVKANQRRIFDDQLRQVLEDFKNCKTNISEKINAEIDLIKGETTEMDTLEHQKLDEQIELFKGEVATLDEKQHKDIDGQIELFSTECKETEDKLHVMLEDHKAKYQENATNLQQGLTKTVKDNIQNVKDAIADFTLNFMNSIDESNELSESNEEKLNIINMAAKNVNQLGDSATWHVFGHKALLASIVDAMWRVKSTITIITPTVEPKILETMSQVAYKKKSARFLYTTAWDIQTFGGIIEKMKVLGNIQFRNLKGANDFFAMSRDSEEIVLCPETKNPKDMISIVSIQDGYAQIFSSFIYPIFQSKSRPI